MYKSLFNVQKKTTIERPDDPIVLLHICFSSRVVFIYGHSFERIIGEEETEIYITSFLSFSPLDFLKLFLAIEVQEGCHGFQSFVALLYSEHT